MSPAAYDRLPVAQHSPEWIALHLDGVSASQMPVVMGNRSGLIELWAAQTGATPLPEPDAALAELFEIGLLLEDDLAELYQRRTGRTVRRANLMLQSRSVPWVRASLDREVVGDPDRIVELKTALVRGWKDGPETVPPAVQDQVQTQMFVKGAEVADVAALESGRFMVYEVARDDGYIDDLLYAARWFRGLVERRQLPPVDSSASTQRALRRLHPYATGQLLTLVGVDPTWDELARRWQDADAALRIAKAEMAAVKAAAMALIGDDVGVESEPGGYRITLANTRSIDWMAVVQDLAPAAGTDAELAYLETIEENTRTDWAAVAKALKAPKGRSKTSIVDAHANADGPRRFYTRFKAAPVADDGPGDADEQEDQAA